jgi:protein involved in polysaccharide export with SLBB domain
LKKTPLVVALSLLVGCTGGPMPGNLEKPLSAPEKAAPGLSYAGQSGALPADDIRDDRCPAAGEPNFILPGPALKTSSPRELSMRYSPGDRFNIQVPGMPDFSGDHVVNIDGRVILPFAGSVPAVGLTNDELQKRIETAFVKAEMFTAEGIRLTVRPVQYAPVHIFAKGAVFGPGRSTINNPNDKEKSDRALMKFGDAPMDRLVASGLRSAGGVRPDADVSRIQVIRGAQKFTLNWRGAFTGDPVDDMALIEGDTIQVPESPCFQSGLVRPTSITPPGMRVFISNLTQPSLSNAAARVDKDSQGMPYGARLLQGVASGNCAGGSVATNANRHVVLIGVNPKTRQSEAIQRSVEELVRSANRDAINPFLMPDDTIVCYDSNSVDTKEAMSFLSSAFGIAQTVHAIRKW